MSLMVPTCRFSWRSSTKPQKTCGLAHHLMPSGDIGEDMGLIASFYADQEGLVPENYSTPRIEQRPAKNPDRQEET